MAVPDSPELDARLELARDRVSAGEWLAYDVVNTGSLRLLLGGDWQLERPADEGWEPVPGPPVAVAAWGASLHPGQSFSEIQHPGASPASSFALSFPIPADIAPGRYRVRKNVQTDPAVIARDPLGNIALRKSIDVHAEFRVVQKAI